MAAYTVAALPCTTAFIWLESMLVVPVWLVANPPIGALIVAEAFNWSAPCITGL